MILQSPHLTHQGCELAFDTMDRGEKGLCGFTLVAVEQGGSHKSDLMGEGEHQKRGGAHCSETKSHCRYCCEESGGGGREREFLDVHWLIF